MFRSQIAVPTLNDVHCKEIDYELNEPTTSFGELQCQTDVKKKTSRGREAQLTELDRAADKETSYETLKVYFTTLYSYGLNMLDRKRQYRKASGLTRFTMASNRKEQTMTGEEGVTILQS